MSRILSTIQQSLLSLMLLIVPIFFLPTTQEFFSTNKYYFLVYGLLLLIAIAAIQLFFGKKITLRKTIFDKWIILFAIIYSLSLLISSPNQIQALTSVPTGLGMILAFTILYFFITHLLHSIKNVLKPIKLLLISASIAGLIRILFFFKPFENVTLPIHLQFLKSPLFSMLGTQMELGMFLGFGLIAGLALLYKVFFTKETHENANESIGGNKIFTIITTVIIASAFVITLYSLFAPSSDKSNTTIVNSQLQLPPYSVSWYAAIDTLKNGKTALFGVGPDNYLSRFTLSKTQNYNGSS
jgi:hypothetical protein